MSGKISEERKQRRVCVIEKNQDQFIYDYFTHSHFRSRITFEPPSTTDPVTYYYKEKMPGEVVNGSCR